MCIALLSTAHPDYALILIDNRDEYIDRPTGRAAWWPSPHSNVLGGRDLLREVQGTWLGVTGSGKIAVLTNFRENVTPPPNAVSRGEIIKKFLTEDVGTTEDFVSSVVHTGVARDAGGFSLVCGRVGEQLAVVSNRAKDDAQVPWICGNVVQTVGLSNTYFGDRTWPKVIDGERLALQAIQEHKREGGTEQQLVTSLLDVLSDDALSRKKINPEHGLEAHIYELRNTILVPPLGRKDVKKLKGDEIAAAKKDEVAEVLNTKEKVEETRRLGVSGIYATQKQTVVLVRHDGKVRFVERTLFDEHSEPVDEKDGVVDITFHIEQDN